MVLPLLTYTANLFPDVNFEKTLFIACQHVHASTFDMFEEYFKKGLKPENTFLIGKCYSTHGETYNKFVEAKVNISPLSKTFDSYASFDEQFLSYIQEFFKEIQARVNFDEFERIIILDDGAHLLLFANDFLKAFDKVVGVEQTSSGYDRLKNVDLNFPVVNVARSKAKLEIESPFIAEVIVEKLNLYLSKSGLQDPKILIIGQGYIGSSIKNILKDRYEVNGCDALSNKCDFGGNYENQLHLFDVIIGATGQTIISEGDFGKLKKGATLISASSSDREFSAVYLRRLTERTGNCHQNFDTEGIRLINGGFPINFTGEKYSLPPERSQFTRGLLSAAVYQAVEEKNKGMVELDEMTQSKIIEEFNQLK